MPDENEKFEEDINNNNRKKIDACPIEDLDFLDMIQNQNSSDNDFLNETFNYVKENIKQKLEDKISLPNIEISKNSFIINNKVDQQLWESMIQELLSSYVLKLSCSENLKEISFKIYKDILNYIEKMGVENPFEVFLSSFKVNSPNYFAPVLLYLGLRYNSTSISQVTLAESLEINVQMMRDIISPFYEYLKNIESYDFIYEIIRPQLLKEKEYFYIIKKYLINYFNWLNKNTSLILKQHNLEKSLLILKNAIDSIKKEEKFQEFYKRLKIKTPKLVAASLCLISIIFFKDYSIDQKSFIELFQRDDNLYLNYSKFSEVYSQFINEFFILDSKKYEHKVFKYLNYYIQKLVSILDEEIQSQEKRNKIFLKINDQFIMDCLSLYRKIIDSRFKIIYFANSNEFHYYFPQIFALSLIYHKTKASKDLEEVSQINNFKKLIQNDMNYRYITEPSNRLYSFLREIMGRRRSQHYSNKDFLTLLEDYLKQFFHLETILIYNLYKNTNLTPQDFAKEIGYRGGRLFDLIDVSKRKINFTSSDTYNRIMFFITNHISLERQDIFISSLNEIKQLRRRLFIHQNVQYHFHYMSDRIKKIENNDLRNGLSLYFKRIIEGHLPDYFYDLNSKARASQFYLKGIREESLDTNDIKNNLIIPLKNHGEIKFYNENFVLCKLTQRIFGIYEKEFKTIPHHLPILNYILINDQNTIAIEIPSWKEMLYKDLTYTGHIDLIRIEGETLIVADYKSNKFELLKSIPQICVYGIMLEYVLSKIINYKYKNIECIIFTKDLGIGFNPNILFSHVLNFIKYMDSRRDTPLVDKRGLIFQKLIKEFKN